MVDWADHVAPAAKGGASSIDNGACVSWLYNYAKRDNSHPGIPLFLQGFPTRDYFFIHQELPHGYLEQTVRFSSLHISDWYFNRSIFRTGLGLKWLHDSQGGRNRQRDSAYYAKAALGSIRQWQKLVRGEPSLTFEARGLVPKFLYCDQLRP